MKICLIAEGCYPYVAGGVSSWIQMLIKGFPQHEFVIFTIGAEQKTRGIYKYEIPENVSRIDEHFLDEYYSDGLRQNSDYNLTKLEKEQFNNLLVGKKLDWNIIFNIFKKSPDFNPSEFLSSRSFLEIIEGICDNEYRDAPFNETFWTIRSMLIPIISILSAKAPDADIYHCVSTGYSGIVGAKFKFETKKPLVITEHGIYTREREEEILKAGWVDANFKQTWINFFKSLSTASYDNADVITALFERAKRTQIELGAPSYKCKIIANGIDIHRFDGIEEVSLTKDEFVVGAIVRVVPIKDIKTMILSFDILKKRIKNAKLYIIGPFDEDPEYYKECKMLIEQLECEGIEFVGRVDIKEWMHKLDLVILTSVSEGQPFVLLEAMSAKRPVLATDVGSCREIIEGFGDKLGDCGFVVPVMNPSLIAKGMIKMAEDRSLMREFARIGYERAVQYYKEEEFIEQYDKLYRSVIR